MAKRSLRPFCTVCSRHFKTPRKFVEHMKSPEHKQKSQEVKLCEKEPWNMEESEELITVDAVGCFEEEDDDDEEEEGISADDTAEDPESFMVQGEDRGADREKEEYNPDTTYGLDYLVPVEGYLCRLCHKFYPSDSAARLTHCKSLVHFQNIQRYKAAKNRMATQGGVSSLKAEDEKEKTTSPTSHKDGDFANLAEKSSSVPAKLTSEKRARGGNEDSDAGFDTAVGTSEEDSGYIMEPEMQLGKSEEGGEVAVDQETAYSDSTLGPVHHNLL